MNAVVNSRSRGRGRVVKLPETPSNSPPIDKLSLKESQTPPPVFPAQQLLILSTPESPKETIAPPAKYKYRRNAPPKYAPISNVYDDEEDEQCQICDRPNKNVLCKTCGHNWRGRKRIECPTHKSTVMLMDMANCPNCQSQDLKEF